MSIMSEAEVSTKARDWQWKELTELASVAGIPASKVDLILETLWLVYHRYDVEAVRAQKRFCMGAVAVYCLSGLAVAVAIGQLLFVPHLYPVVAAEVLAMIAALLLLTVSHRRQWKQQWLTTRYIAEQLRMRMYLAVVPPPSDGLAHGEAVMDPSRTLPFYNQLGARLPADVEDAIRGNRLSSCAVDNVSALKAWLGHGWIEDQVRFHKGAAKRHERASHIARRVTILCFAVTLVAAMLHAVGIGHGDSSHGEVRGNVMTNLLTFLSIALPTMASAVHAINDLLDHERITARSDGMARILEQLAASLEEAQTLEQVRELAWRTEQVMTIENFEWMAALSFRQVPHAPA
jgi:hypothetical protein